MIMDCTWQLVLLSWVEHLHYAARFLGSFWSFSSIATAQEAACADSVFGRGDGRKRSYEQLCLLAATGREARARSKARQLVEASGQALTSLAETVNDGLSSRGPRLLAVQVKGKRQFALCSNRSARFLAGGRRSKQKLTAHEICSIAFSKRHNRAAQADMHEVSRQTVRRSVLAAGHTLLEAQLVLLRDFRGYVAAHPPDIASAVLMFDETSQTLALDAVHGTKMYQQKSAWTVLVARLHFALGYLGQPGIKMYRELVFPPLPLATNNAASIHAGLYEHPLSEPLLRFTHEILAVSRIAAFTFESDGHLANEKLFYHRRNEARQQESQQAGRGAGAGLPLFMEQLLCGNHQTNLVLTDTLQAATRNEETGGRLIPNLYAGTLFLRMGGHYLKVLGSLQVHIKDPAFFAWVQNPSPSDRERGRKYRLELSAFMQANLRHNDRQMTTSPGQLGTSS